MKIVGSRSPLKIELLNTEKNISTVALRKDIVEKFEYDKLTGRPQVQYEYEEVKIRVKVRLNLFVYIEANFDNWFQNGLKLEQLEEDIKTKQLEMTTLIDNYGQLDINTSTKTDILISYEALGSLYIDNMNLTNVNIKLKEDNLLLMKAISELYIMITGV